MLKYESRLACPYDKEAPLIEDSRAGDVICSACGLVVGERLVDVSSEWRTFSDDGNQLDRSRVGAVDDFLRDGNNLNTIVNPVSRIHVANSTQLINHPKNTAPKRSRIDATLDKGYDCIRDLSGRINLPRVIVDEARFIFKQCAEKDLLRQRNLTAIGAACLLFSCRAKKQSYTIKEMCSISGLPKTNISRAMGHISKHIQVTNTAKQTSVDEFMFRFCANLQIDNHREIAKTAQEVHRRTQEMNSLQGRSPDSMAAVAIYLATLALNMDVSLENISVATGASVTTIRLIYKLLLPHVSDLFPPKFSFKCPPHRFPRS